MEMFLKVAFILYLATGSEMRSVERFEINETPAEANNRPIIGLLTKETKNKTFGDEFIETTYVQFLESAGARVVPIRGNRDASYYLDIFSKINGALFPGGGVSIKNGPYYESGYHIYHLAKEANDRGDYFPIWATCLGWELLTELTLDRYILKATDSENISLPLDLKEGYQKSRLLAGMSQNLAELLQREPLTQNNHRWSVLLEDFENEPKLKNSYRLISTNKDRNGLEYVSTLEAYKYPFYATQWHPEKNVFLWNAHSAINHSFHAVEVTQYVADFFVNEARKNHHQFDSIEEEAKALIENAVRVYIPSDAFSVNYFFNFTKSASN